MNDVQVSISVYKLSKYAVRYAVSLLPKALQHKSATQVKLNLYSAAGLLKIADIILNVFNKDRYRPVIAKYITGYDHKSQSV